MVARGEEGARVPERAERLDLDLHLRWARFRLDPDQNPKPDRLPLWVSDKQFEFPEALLIQAAQLEVPPEEITMLQYKMDNIREAAKGTLPGDWPAWVANPSLERPAPKKP